MVTATVTKTEITINEPFIEDSIVQVNWNEALNRNTAGEIVSALDQIDGIRFTELRYDYRGIILNLIPSLVDPEAIARTAVYTVRSIITQSSDPIIIETRLRTDGSGYYALQTDYRHTDAYLLQVLRQEGYADPFFIEGDYTIRVYKTDVDFSTLARKLRKLVNNFYNGKLPQQPLYYERTDEKNQEQFELLFSRRIPNEQQNELVRTLVDQVPGLHNCYIQVNGHEVTGRAANELFSKNRVANQVAIIVEDFYSKLDTTD
jgi:hypothetical protein